MDFSDLEKTTTPLKYFVINFKHSASYERSSTFPLLPDNYILASNSALLVSDSHELVNRLRLIHQKVL
jgi:hypothetical protein